MVLTEIGPVQIEVPRDRDASFGPLIVRKRQWRLDGIGQIVLSLTARADHRRDRRADHAPGHVQGVDHVGGSAPGCARSRSRGS
jgi:hypothetical protein